VDQDDHHPRVVVTDAHVELRTVHVDGAVDASVTAGGRTPR
jgi:hypothetical protein